MPINYNGIISIVTSSLGHLKKEQQHILADNSEISNHVIYILAKPDWNKCLSMLLLMKPNSVSEKTWLYYDLIILSIYIQPC